MRSGKWIKVTFSILLLAGVYFLGPAPEAPEFDKKLPAIPSEPDALEEFVRQKESQHKVKPDNEARIVWADSTKAKTQFAIVYLHGFSASQKEGDPVHRRLAAEFGYNLYLSRLSDHGVDTTEALQLFTADRIWNSAKEALVIGKRLGEKVILVSTSTGGTLALKLAAEYPQDVYGLINLSPNIAINNPAAFLLDDPWGLQIARMVMGGKYRVTGSGEASPYWTGKYRLESIVELESLIEATMTPETFRNVKQPSLTLYYYKNEQEQDPEVKVSAMIEMNKELGTPDSLKVIQAVPEAGAHVIGSSLTSKDVNGVYRAIKEFAITRLRLTPLTMDERELSSKEPME